MPNPAAAKLVEARRLTPAATEAGSCHGEVRKAHAVDARAKQANLARLKRIEGQVRGIYRMVDEDRYCADTLAQISAIHQALRAVQRELMRNHLKHCARNALMGDERDAEAMYDELIELIYKHAR